jgi:hypothetical protein
MYKTIPRASTRKVAPSGAPGWLLIKTTGAPGVAVGVGVSALLPEEAVQPARNRAARVNKPAARRAETERIVLFINPPPPV